MAAGIIIDFHTHAFPDTIAVRAVPALEKAGNVQASTNGTVNGLLASMDRAGISCSVICSIATRVEQFASILDWSRQIRSERIIPLPSVHPEDPDLVPHLRAIAGAGFVGIKLHPYYQHFYLAEQRLDTLYGSLEDLGLLLVVHSGFDIAYPRDRRSDPAQVEQVLEKFPGLRLVTTHLGGWDDWDEVERLLIGKPVYMDISFALQFLTPNRARQMLTSHPSDYILFGSDSPWTDQSGYLQRLQNLELGEELQEKILGKNAEKLLGKR
jgi:predicted TIM-barrel fold metal-dependent hydrolase